jgi:EmrB/QacA subfamily drug resistance transporter
MTAYVARGRTTVSSPPAGAHRAPRAGGTRAYDCTAVGAHVTRAAPSTLALIVILSAQLMVVLDFSIVNVALPSIQRDLGFSSSGGQWVVTAYAITFGGLLILGGRAGDLLGRRRLFLAGLTAFSMASLAGGFASSGGVLVAARAAQGVGAALIAPTALALLATSYSEGAARNRALGMYGATASVGFVAGLVLGGILVTAVGWRAVFWVNVPIGIAAAVFGRTSLPADEHRRPRGGLDVIGAVLVTVATATLAYLPAAGSIGGWGSVVGGGLLGVVLLGAFVVWELRHAHPLVRLGIFRLRTLSAANGVTVLFGAWNAGEVLVLALYLQRVLGYSPLKAGLASVPQGLAGLAAGLVGARLADRFGIKAVLLATTGTAVVGHLLLSGVAAQGHYLLVGMALLAVGFGNGGTSLAATVAGSAGVADREQGLAGGLINSARQIGSALGVAALMAVAASVAAGAPAPAAALARGYREALVVAAALAAAAFAVAAAFIHADDGHGRRRDP